MNNKEIHAAKTVRNGSQINRPSQGLGSGLGIGNGASGPSLRAAS